MRLPPGSWTIRRIGGGVAGVGSPLDRLGGHPLCLKAGTRDVVDIVEDLLVTARAEAGQLSISIEPCPLGEEARRVADLVGNVSVDVGAVWTEADPVRLRQVLRNLSSKRTRPRWL